MKVFANIISAVFHPLLMVMYGMALALSFTYLDIYPAAVKMYLLAGVALCTIVVPGLILLLMIKGGMATDLELTNRHERAIPYLVFIASNMTCLFYLLKMQMPLWMLSMFGGVCLSLFVALFINFAWKISIHTLGAGSLFGAIMGVARTHALNPAWLLIAVVIAAGLLASSRMILGKHTPLQVYAGFLLGLACTFAASFAGHILY
ncbi:MAG: phosphatase PAP2 family protein [Tannerellaceae bacterium]|jgi:membrane-associated phospholipid phosphatase|nr:phosphatase PAP2 family protein [Tannerellaceae bacterium]